MTDIQEYKKNTRIQVPGPYIKNTITTTNKKEVVRVENSILVNLEEIDNQWNININSKLQNSRTNYSKTSLTNT